MRNSKKTIVTVLICLLSSILLIVTLYALSYKPNYSKNGFTRIKKENIIKSKKILELKYSGYYIAGITSNKIYLANYQTPIYLLTTDYNLSDSNHCTLNLKDTSKFRWENSRISIDSPNIFLSEGITPKIFRGSLTDFKMTLFNLQNIFFTSSLPISSTSLALKSVENISNKQTVLLKETNLPPYIKKNDSLLTKEINGLFSNDGMLSYEKSKNKLIYVYHYKNGLICFDTSMKLLYRGNTIDTNFNTKIKIGNQSATKITLSSPPDFVNLRSAVSDDKIFIQSQLIADNERKSTFNLTIALDVYSLKDGHYLYTCYIPAIKNKKMTDFKIYKNKVIVIYDTSILYVYETTI
jgi:hypothetical protein